MLCPLCNAKTEVTISTLCDVGPSLRGQKRFYPVCGMVARIRECARLMPEMAALCKYCGHKYNYTDDHKCVEKHNRFCKEDDEIPMHISPSSPLSEEKAVEIMSNAVHDTPWTQLKVESPITAEKERERYRSLLLHLNHNGEFTGVSTNNIEERSPIAPLEEDSIVERSLAYGCGTATGLQVRAVVRAIMATKGFQPTWRPISEAPKEHGAEFLAYDPDVGMYNASRYDDKIVYTWNQTPCFATHFMPLPNSPKGS